MTKLQAEILSVAEEQGWSDLTLIQMLITHIESIEEEESLKEYLSEVVIMESELSDFED